MPGPDLWRHQEGSPRRPRRWLNQLQIAFGLALLAAATITTEALGARSTHAPLALVPSQPVQGIYEYCAPQSSSDACLRRLSRIAAGGFKVVLNYAVFYADPWQLRRYMDQASRLGVKLIWPMQDAAWWGHGSLAAMYPRLAAGCRCSDATLGRHLINLVKGSWATWGYSLADEAPPADAPAVEAFSRQLHGLDPVHPRLAIAAGDDALSGLLAPYASAADVLGADSYPVGAGQGVARVSFIASNVRAVADRAHRRTAMVLQAFNWSQYPKTGPWPAPRWPTAAEMRRMREEAIAAAHPSLILWYSAFDVLRGRDASRHWRGLLWAAFGR
jgi:hypothetical protein